MSKPGYIKLHRCIEESFLYPQKREFTEFEAWLDILMNVNFADAKVKIGNDVYTCLRGQSLLSLDSWGNRWFWHKSKVRRFFEVLKKESMITTESLQKTTRLTVCKYEHYQDSRNASETHLKRVRNESETHLTPREEEEEEKEGKRINIAFSVFWDMYDKKVGEKGKLEKKWNDLSEKDRVAIIEYLPKYKSANPDKAYRKDPQTFLNNKSWNDEIIIKLAEMPVVHRERKFVR